ncbi:MAG: 5-formyltetrahydrofolate cyclo-ligase [Simkaniaceae bacterium]|nr:5-formyltetrahydrofolate cyclo-ligase [Simkaniaceae bacterium]
MLKEKSLQNEDVHFQKWEKRLAFLEMRDNLPQSRRKEAILQLNEELYKLIHGAECVLSFCSMGSEIDLTEFNEKLAFEGRLALPRVEGEELIPFRVNSLRESLEITRWKILEPIPEKCLRIGCAAIDVVLVPGVAFDSDGFRLGYGKGFYDRFLNGIQSIGVGFKEQLNEGPLPRFDHDVAVSKLALY